MTRTKLDLRNAQSWVVSANDPGRGFPLQNLPYCAFLSLDGTVQLGVGIGSSVLDLGGLSRAGYLDQLGDSVVKACQQPDLNGLMLCGPVVWSELRETLASLLVSSVAPDLQASLSHHLLSMDGITFTTPVSISNYTDFYASIEHATNVGRLFRPDQPLLPNYMYVPIGYHGRASSLVMSGEPIVRPHGQVKAPQDNIPSFRPSAQLDYELEVAAYIGVGNPLGTPIPIGSAERHIFGYSLLNDWSARDIQSWEYQPLGPFLGKNFGSSLSPWVVVNEAIAAFRVPRAKRPEGNPVPLPYLDDRGLDVASAIDMTLEVYLSTAQMRTSSMSPELVSTGNLRDLYWSFSQMIAHHTCNGCNLASGDLLGSGTVSGATPGSEGSLLERTRRGQNPLSLPSGESRGFLEDGDEVILRGYCQGSGLPRISLGECRGMILPAKPYP